MNDDDDRRGEDGDRHDEDLQGLPEPTAPFRRRAWMLFQRTLDPLAPPRPLPMRRGPR
jgi:hypothetical protein